MTKRLLDVILSPHHMLASTHSQLPFFVFKMAENGLLLGISSPDEKNYETVSKCPRQI